MLKNNKKISIVLPNLGGGGAEKLHIYLANEWVSKGYNIEFILLRKEGIYLPLLDPSISVVNLNASRIRNAIIPLAKQLYKSRPKIVLAAMWPLTLVAVFSWILSGKIGKLFLSEHENLSQTYIRQLRTNTNVLKNSIRFIYPIASGVVAVSKGVKDDLCLLGNLSFNEIKVIYNPAAIGISAIRETHEVRDLLWGGDVEQRILTVGRLTYEKDHKTLIEAFALIPKKLNMKLIILGEGPLRKELSNLINVFDLKDRISMPGFTTDPYPWYRSADLFVLSSRWEGFGNVIVEALECGLPVVSTKCPSGPGEILENGKYGTLVPTQDPAALAKAIINCLSTVHNREKLIRRAGDFSVTKISDEYLSYFLKN
jgi:glycosyltransferase involved in cell wall biosynthesis